MHTTLTSYKQRETVTYLNEIICKDMLSNFSLGNFIQLLKISSTITG